MMKNIKYALLAVALLIPAISYAQAPNPKLSLEQVQQMAKDVSDSEFKKMDKDGDGQISKDEYMGYVLEETIAKQETAFNQIDQNHDGKVSKEEYEDFMNFATNKIHDFMLKMKQGQLAQ